MKLLTTSHLIGLTFFSYPFSFLPFYTRPPSQAAEHMQSMLLHNITFILPSQIFYLYSFSTDENQLLQKGNTVFGLVKKKSSKIKKIVEGHTLTW